MRQILVIGSTGKTGKRVYERLVAKGVAVRPASRNSPIPFDWYRQDTWSAALQQIEAVYITFQPDLAVPASVGIVANFVEAARVCGVKKLVLLSGRGEAEAVACEGIVTASGLDWTVLRASFFMQNYSEGFWLDGILSGEFVIPEVRVREPFVDAEDIADVAAAAVLNREHNGRIYELTGPELLTFEETILKISKGLETPVRFRPIPVNDYAGVLREAGLPQDVIWLITYLFTEVLDGRNESVKHDIQHVLGRKAGSFDQYVHRTVRGGLWQKKD